MRSRAICTAAALAACLSMMNAYADNECGKGVRETTAAERAAIKSVLDAVKRALPPAPQGWVIDNEDEPSIAEICRDYEQKPWVYSHQRYYRETAGEERRQAAVAAAGQRSTADLASKQPRLDALTAKIVALAPAVAEAAQKNDFARLTALSEEGDKLRAEQDRIMQEGGNPADQFDAFAKKLYADTEISISVYINPNSDGLPSDAAPVTPPRGATAAARRLGGDGTTHATSDVAFGTWRSATDGSSEPVRRAGPPHSPHGITVHVDAADERIDQVVSSIDFGAIGRLLAP